MAKPKIMTSRRDFIRMSALFSVAVAAGGAVASANQNISSSVEIIQQRLFFRDLPPSFNGYRIGFLSDLHLGDCADSSLIETAVEMLNRESPDLIVLGGDYILLNDTALAQTTFSMREAKQCFMFNRTFEKDITMANSLFSRVAELLASLKAKDGVFAVLGNHDSWGSSESCIAHFENRGLRMLVNESVEIKRDSESLLLHGCDDYWTGAPTCPPCCTAKTDQQFRLVLSHNPDFLSHILKTNSAPFELGLAGHTHGGQVCFPLLGPIVRNISDSRMLSGLWELNEAKTYTTRGIGTTGIPWRMNCPPEATLITLSA